MDSHLSNQFTRLITLVAYNTFENLWLGWSDLFVLHWNASGGSKRDRAPSEKQRWKKGQNLKEKEKIGKLETRKKRNSLPKQTTGNRLLSVSHRRRRRKPNNINIDTTGSYGWVAGLGLGLN